MPPLNPATLTIAGETRTVAQWARISGLDFGTIYHRIRAGVDPYLAVFEPVHSKILRSRLSDALPVHKPKSRKRPPVRFDVGPLLRWGSVRSVTFRRAA